MALKRMLACLIAFVLVAAAPVPAVAQETAKEKDGKKDDALSKLKDWFDGTEVLFSRLPVFNLSVIRQGRVAGQVSISVTLETNNSGNKKKIIENRTRLQNAFLRDLHGVVSLDNGTGRAILTPTVKARLQKAADRVLGPGVVRNILIENISARNLD